MTNRKLVDIVRNRKPLALTERDTMQQACRHVFERGTGSVLVIDDEQRLTGIFTGCDASADKLGRGIALWDICRAPVPFGNWRGAVVGGMS